jgi:hypothetical protein
VYLGKRHLHLTPFPLTKHSLSIIPPSSLLQDQFVKTLGSATPLHPTAFRESLFAALEDLPGHCLSEVRGSDWVRWLGPALMGVQLAAAYLATNWLVLESALKEH